MIHSCAGGVIRDKKSFTLAKVEILSTGEPRWYISNLPLLEVGDEVIVPFGKENFEVRARVLRIDKGVSEQVTPVPLKSLKEIFRLAD